jgi:hypothetical protein
MNEWLYVLFIADNLQFLICNQEILIRNGAPEFLL